MLYLCFSVRISANKLLLLLLCVTVKAPLRRSSTKAFLQAKTRNSSGDETANVNFLYDDIVHSVSATDNYVKCPCNNFIKRHFNQYFVNNNNNDNRTCTTKHCASPAPNCTTRRSDHLTYSINRKPTVKT